MGCAHKFCGDISCLIQDYSVVIKGAFSAKCRAKSTHEALASTLLRGIVTPLHWDLLACGLKQDIQLCTILQ